ncbi:MAG TPA: hypothetical protein VFX60_17515 [Micromonospora sp.]|nr:hypothetical protein [Micromonospora sp.]
MRSHPELITLRRQAVQALTSLNLRGTFTFSELHERIERHRGRPVHLIPRDLPALAPHGLWVAGEHADYVFYAANANQVRQRLIIGHEYGHMIFDDASTPAEFDQVAAMLMPDVDPSVSQIMLARRTYDQPIERRAEVFGTVVVQRAESWSDLPVAVADPEVSARLASTLEGRPGAW